MKSRLFLCSAVLLLQACDKSEEKPARKVITGPPPPEKTTRRPAVPRPAVEGPPGGVNPAAPVSPATPPTREEVDAFYASMDAFVKEATPVVESDAPPAEKVRNSLRLKLIELTRTRGKLMSGMTLEQRKEMAPRLAPLAKLQSALLRPVLPSLPGTVPAPATNNATPQEPVPSAPPPGTPAPPP